jgi:hypothetical protein
MVEPESAAAACFDAQDAETVVVPAAPVFERYQQYFEAAVPVLAAADLRLAIPVVIVARVTALTARGRRRPAGPRDRAKALMDALHDQRRKPPFFRELGRAAPIPDDNPNFVRGLAVEIHAGPTAQVEYRLGTALQVNGEVLIQVDVDRVAPNDIVAFPSERERIEREREEFVAELVRAWPTGIPPLDHATTLVVRHHPHRDEDNTWGTWLGALTGRSSWSRDRWGDSPPLASWRPSAVASVSGADLPCATRLELIGPASGNSPEAWPGPEYG